MNALVQPPGVQERPGWVGPLFFWEVVRQSRNKGLFVWRMLYAAVLLLVLYLHFGGAVSAKDAALLSESAVQQYLIVQFLAVLILTPIFVAGSLIEDRQNNTLPLLLTTFLTPREIVFGKLAGRLLNVVSVLLAGLPVLALLVLFGGVNVTTLLLQTILALLLMVVMGIYTMRASVTQISVGSAILYSYWLAAKGLGIGCLFLILDFPVMLLLGIRGELDISVYLICVISTLVYTGYSLFRTVHLVNHSDRNENAGTASSRADNQHIVIPYERRNAVIDWSPVKEENEPLQYHVAVRHFRIPAVTSWPLWWKDSYFPISNLFYVVMSIGSVLVGFIFICLLAPLTAGGIADSFCQEVAFILMLVTLVVVSLRAARSFAEEGQKKTLVSLLIMLVPLDQIIFQKWLACFWRFRPLLILTGLVLLTLAFYFPTRWPLLVLVYLGQLACWSLLGVAISLWHFGAFRTRSAVGVLLFISFFILPRGLMRLYEQIPRNVISTDDTMTDRAPLAQAFYLFLCPYDSWVIILNQDRLDRRTDLIQIPWGNRKPVKFERAIGFSVLERNQYVPAVYYHGGGSDRLNPLNSFPSMSVVCGQTCFALLMCSIYLFLACYFSLRRLRTPNRMTCSLDKTKRNG